MLIYYVLVFLPIIYYFVGKFVIKDNKVKEKSFIFFFLIFLILLSLRSVFCGTDLLNYQGIFNYTSNLSFFNLIENYSNNNFLFYVLNKLSFILNNDFQFFIFICAFISVVPILFLYKKYSSDFLLTIALFLTIAPFQIFFSGLRQALALGFVALSFHFIKNKKCIYFIFTIIIASLFHQSAIYCIILYPLYYTNISKNWLLLVIPVICLSFVFKTQVFSFLINIVASSYFEKYNIIEANGAYSIFILLFIFLIYSFIIPNKNKLDRDFIGLRNFLLLATLIQVFVSINPIIMRINYYLLLFIPLLIPKIKEYVNSYNLKSVNFISLFLIIFLLFYYFYNAYNGSDALNIYPYISFLE